MQFSLLYFSSSRLSLQITTTVAGRGKVRRSTWFYCSLDTRTSFSRLWHLPQSICLMRRTRHGYRAIRLRAGSVVLPLQNNSVAEEWSVVDNLSRGRVDIAFARGWNIGFSLWPQNYANSKSCFQDSKRCKSSGKQSWYPMVLVKKPRSEFTLPRQRNCLFGSRGSRETFIEAGALGTNVFFFQEIEELAKN